MTNTTTSPSTTTATSTTSTSTTSTTSTMAPCPVSWFEIHTADPARAKQFYGDVFGWTYDESMPEYPMIGLGNGAPIGGGVVDNGGQYPSHALFVVEVPDVAASLASVVDHGGSIIADVQTSPMGLTYGYAANPDGSVFGVWCPAG
jgi:predicted enzyme related to lactoylglutathione lyase